MLYKIQISGGFAGMMKDLTGEIKISEERKVALKRMFNIDNQEGINKNLRDTFNYMVQLEIDNKWYKKSFDDHSIPQEIIHLIEQIKKKQNL